MRELRFTGPGRLPTRTHPGDAGFDLYVNERAVIKPGEFVDVACGLQMALPEHMWARITGRSSAIRGRGLMVVEGVIDPGYRGPLFSAVFNLGKVVQIVQEGERVAQMLLFRNEAPGFEPIWVDPVRFDSIPHDGRGSNGFGSSGV